jgi:type VI secretion system protein ImpM
MSDANDSGPGFFGKVSSHGDFVGRRLPPSFLGVWDAWLQASLQSSREQLGAGWLDAYLTGPIWRFALAPGVCDSQAWAGLLMPSVDRVGRHFPLTVAAPAGDGGAMLDWLGGGQQWFDEAESLALDTLEADFVLENFDAALAALPMPPHAGAAAGGGAGGIAGPGGYRLALGSLDALGSALPLLAGAALYGQSLWWTDGSDTVEPVLLLCRGLPAPAAFAAMLAGA